MRSTSAHAYQTIKENGLLGALQLETYEIVLAYGPMTAGEAASVYELRHPGTHRKRNEIAKRISDLKTFGLAREVDRRACKVTGMLAGVVEIIDALPAGKSARRRPCPHCDGRGYLAEPAQAVTSSTAVFA